MIGYIPSVPDKRDYSLTNLGIAVKNNFPDEYKVDGLPPIYNQGQTGMCWAFTLAYIKEWQEYKETGERIRFSPAFIYLDGNLSLFDDIEGLSPRYSLSRIKKNGTCSFDEFPTIGTRKECKEYLETIDKNKLYGNAYPNRINSYFRLNTVEEIKTVIMTLGPIGVSIKTCQQFHNARYNGGYVVAPQSEFTGAHGVSIVGWNSFGWIFANSYGERWGDKGYGYLSYNYPIEEAWGISDIKAPKKEVKMYPNKKIYVLNNVAKFMDVEPIIKNDRMLVPIRAVAQAFEIAVEWNGEKGEAIFRK